jgi:phage major head subunit gpT-like protein
VKYSLRKILGQLSANPAELAKHLPVQLRSSIGSIVEMREVGGKTAIAAARRDELLEACAAGRHVEIEVDLLAYEQKTGEQNRNSVRFRDGAMVELGHTGKGTPFLRDHAQYDSLSKAGTIIASSTEKRAEGDYCIRQTVKLVAPWAVEHVLRGLMDAVSIGWRPTGPVMCSACNAPVYTKCWHWPGDRLVEKDDEGGGKRKVRQADGPIVVEWIYTKAELVETSMVNIGGVPQARAGEVRAALFASLSAGDPGLRSVLEQQALNLEGDDPEEQSHMDPEKLEELKKTLGLPPTATIAEVLAAAKTAHVAAVELTVSSKDLEALNAKIKALETDKSKRDEDAFITDALSSGRIAKADEESWRALHQVDAKRAGELMAKRAQGSATPAGTPMQSGSPNPKLRGTMLEADHQPVITGGGVPGYELYARGERSPAERADIKRQLSASVQALETHPSPKAILWAQRCGFQGNLKHAPQLAATGTTIANNTDLDASRVGFTAAFMQSLEGATVSPSEALFETVRTATPDQTINWMGDLPSLEEWTSERKLSGLEALKLILASKKWASGIRVKNDDVKYDRLGLMPSQISGLANKARRHPLDRMVEFMVQGSAGGASTNGLGYDGAFFFANAHKGGNDNLQTVALDAAGLTAAELLLESMTTYDSKDVLDTHGTHLVVGPKLRATAEKLLTQDRLANGEDNYHRGKYKLIVENRIRGAADDYYFLADLSKSIKPFIKQLVEDISTSAVIGQAENNSVPSFMNDELWFGAQMNYNISYWEFRLIVGGVVG